MSESPYSFRGTRRAQRRAEAAMPIWERFAAFDRLMDDLEAIRDMPTVSQPRRLRESPRVERPDGS